VPRDASPARPPDATQASPARTPDPAGFDVIDVQARVVHEPSARAPSPPVRESDSASSPPPLRPHRDGSPQGHPPGERFVAGTFGNASDRRGYKLFIPPQAGDRALPLVVMLHGCTQDPDDFAAGTDMNALARAHGFYVLYPAQSRQANPQGCWNWFKHTHQQRGRGEPALLAGMTQDVIAQHRVDAQRVYVAGLSAGGAMAAILGDAYPELFAAVGVHSGLATGSALDLPSALAAMKGGGRTPAAAASGVPTIVFHGDSDATVHLNNAEQVIAACTGATATLEVAAVEDTGARRATRILYRDASGQIVAERWTVHGAAHAWSGGRAAGSFTDGRGPDASAQMLRFFLEHPHAAQARTHEAAARRA